MNIQQAKEEIKHTVKAYLLKDETGEYRIPTIRQRPILLMGPPGIGKTQIMEQIARECQIGLVSYTITHHTRQSAVGLPMIKQEEFEGKTYSVTEYTMSEIIASVYEKIRDFGQKEGILFIDEINCVSETLTPAMLQFLQCKTFGNQKIPEGWLIVAAGNPPEYNKSVRDFDTVTLDRVRYISVDAELSVWQSYAKESHVHGAILSYLEIRPRNFYRVEETVDGQQFVTARGWEDLSSLLKIYEEIEVPVTEEIIHEFLQNDEIAEDFFAYLELYRKYQDDYRIPQILEGEVPAAIYARLLTADLDEKFSVVYLLLDALTQSFTDVYQCKKLTDAWFALLKNYKNELEQSCTPVESYDNLVAEVEKELAFGKQSGYLSTEDQKIKYHLIGLLKDNRPKEEPYFDSARAGFTEQTQFLAKKRETAQKQLEYAFDFMEAAFSDGQEMLIFVTGLTMGKESAVFLAENVCERYLTYNERFLAGTKRTELLKQLER